MKILLLDIPAGRHFIKDFANGYGASLNRGKGILEKIIAMLTRVDLPLVTLGTLAGIFNSKGHDVAYSKKVSKAKKADLVIVHPTVKTYKEEICIINSIKKKSPSIKIGLVGPMASFLPELFVNYADFIIKGEPEEVAMKISDSFIPHGIVVSKPLPNLDKLPFPYWKIFPIKEYFYKPLLWVRPILPILTSRGCSSKCSYCPYIIFRNRWCANSAKYVLNEIKHFVDEYKIKGLVFRDPLLTYDRKRILKICEGLVNNFKLEFLCETRLDLLDKELVDSLCSAGLKWLNVGIESVNTKLLNKLGRKIKSVEHQKKIIRYCQSKGIKVNGFYMIGIPSDTKENVLRTIELSKSLTDYSQFYISTPYPGTAFYNFVKNKIKRDFNKFDGQTPVFKHSKLSEKEITDLLNRTVKYHFSIEYISRNWREICKKCLSAMRILK